MPIEDRTFRGQQLMVIRCILEPILTPKSVASIIDFQVEVDSHLPKEISSQYIKKIFQN